MIITRTPLRISLGGGGTDLPSYYERGDGGFLIAGSIVICGRRSRRLPIANMDGVPSGENAIYQDRTC